MRGSVNEEFLRDVKDTFAYKFEGVILDFTESMLERMEKMGLSRSQLAEKLGVKPSYITRILRGNHNFTLESLVKIADVLGCEIRLHLQPQGHKTRWFDVKENPAYEAAATASPRRRQAK